MEIKINNKELLADKLINQSKITGTIEDLKELNNTLAIAKESLLAANKTLRNLQKEDIELGKLSYFYKNYEFDLKTKIVNLESDLKKINEQIEKVTRGEIYLKKQCDHCKQYASKFYLIDGVKYCEGCYETEIKKSLTNVRKLSDSNE